MRNFTFVLSLLFASSAFAQTAATPTPSPTPTVPVGTLDFTSKEDWGSLTIVRGVTYTGPGTEDSSLLGTFPTLPGVIHAPVVSGNNEYETTQLCSAVLNEPAANFIAIGDSNLDITGGPIQALANYDVNTNQVTFVSSDDYYGITDLYCMRSSKAGPTFEDSIVATNGETTIAFPRVMDATGNPNYIMLASDSFNASLTGLCQVYGFKTADQAATTYFAQPPVPTDLLAFNIESYYSVTNLGYSHTLTTQAGFMLQSITCK
jgi:hypothetical protein